MELLEKKAELQLQFAANLDTVIPTSAQDVENVIKAGALTARHLALSDTQLVDKPGLHQFIARKDVQEFLRNYDIDNAGPIVSLIRNCPDYGDVLKSMVCERQEPILLSTLNAEQNERLRQYYQGGNKTDLGYFFDVANEAIPGFDRHIEVLNKLFLDREHTLIKSAFPSNQYQYINLLKNAVEQRRNAIARLRGLDIDSGVEYQLNILFDCLERAIACGEVNRSGFYRMIDTAHGVANRLKEAVKRTIVDITYNTSFAVSNKMHMITGGEYKRTHLTSMGASSFAEDLASDKEWQSIDLIELPMPLNKLTFDSIMRIRQSGPFRFLASNLCNPSSKKEEVLREYFTYLVGALESERQKMGARKHRVRIEILKHIHKPHKLKPILEQHKLGFWDIFSFWPQAGSLVVGEIVEKGTEFVPLVGPFLAPVAGEATQLLVVKFLPKRAFGEKHVINFLVSQTSKAGVP